MEMQTNYLIAYHICAELSAPLWVVCSGLPRGDEDSLV